MSRPLATRVSHYPWHAEASRYSVEVKYEPDGGFLLTPHWYPTEERAREAAQQLLAGPIPVAEFSAPASPASPGAHR